MPNTQLKNPVKFIHLIFIVTAVLFIGAYNPIMTAFEHGFGSFQYATAKEIFIIESLYIPFSIAMAIGILIITMVSNNDSWNDFIKEREEKPSFVIKSNLIGFFAISLFVGWSSSQLIPFVYGIGFSSNQDSTLFITHKELISVNKIEMEIIYGRGMYGSKPIHKVRIQTGKGNWLTIANSSDTVFDLKGKKDLAIYQTVSSGGNLKKTCVASQSWEKLNKIPRCYLTTLNYK